MTIKRVVEPMPVVQLVEDYVRSELSDQEKFTNREPLDDSGVFSLHRLAGEIYALGFNDGESAQAERDRARRNR